MQQGLDMIPLMMEQDFKAKGWLGLLLGTRMYYLFYACAIDTEAKFARQMDALTREIGDRGKRSAAKIVRASDEKVSMVPTAAPAPAPAPLSALMQTAVASDLSTSSSVVPTSQQKQEQNYIRSEVSDVSIFMQQQQERDDKARAELDGRLDELRNEIKMNNALSQTPKQVVSSERLVSLQARLHRLHRSDVKLLSDEELYAVEVRDRGHSSPLVVVIVVPPSLHDANSCPRTQMLLCCSRHKICLVITLNCTPPHQ